MRRMLLPIVAFLLLTRLAWPTELALAKYALKLHPNYTNKRGAAVSAIGGGQAINRPAKAIVSGPAKAIVSGPAKAVVSGVGGGPPINPKPQ